MAGHIVAMGGGGFMVEDDSPARTLPPLARRETASANLLRPDAQRRLGPRHRRVLRGFRAARLRAQLPPAVRRPRAPGRAPRRTGRRLRLGREHGERPRDLAPPRRRRSAARGVGARRRGRWDERGRELLVRVLRHRLLRACSSIRCATGSGSCPGASARTTTARSAAAPCTARSSTVASRPATRQTTAPRSTSRGPSSARSSAPAQARAPTVSRPGARRRSTRGCCEEHRLIASASGNGKTTVGRALAGRLDVPFYELDALHHGPDWAPATAEELRAKVEPIVASHGWVIDGGYRGKIGDLVPEAADLVVWLDLPMRVWFPRLLRTNRPATRPQRGALERQPRAHARRSPPDELRRRLRAPELPRRRAGPSGASWRASRSSGFARRREVERFLNDASARASAARRPMPPPAARARSASGARRRRGRRDRSKPHENASQRSGTQPFSRRSPVPPGGGRKGCAAAARPARRTGSGRAARRSCLRGRAPAPLDEADDAHRRLLDRELGDVDDGAAQPAWSFAASSSSA